MSLPNFIRWNFQKSWSNDVDDDKLRDVVMSSPTESGMVGLFLRGPSLVLFRLISVSIGCRLGFVCLIVDVRGDNVKYSSTADLNAKLSTRVPMREEYRQKCELTVANSHSPKG